MNKNTNLKVLPGGGLVETNHKTFDQQLRRAYIAGHLAGLKGEIPDFEKFRETLGK